MNPSLILAIIAAALATTRVLGGGWQPAANPAVIAEIEGETPHTSKPFLASQPFTIYWKGGEPGGSFYVSIIPVGDHSVPDVVTHVPGQGSHYVRASGRYYIRVVASSRWQIRIVATPDTGDSP